MWDDESIQLYKERIEALKKYKEMADRAGKERVPFKICFKAQTYETNERLLNLALRLRGLQ